MRGAIVRLPCWVRPGMFSTERLVSVPLGGTNCVGYVDANLIDDQGRLRAQVWDVREDVLDIVLPGVFDNHLIAVNRGEVEILEKEYAT